MKMLLESHDYVSLLFRNISFYLRLTLAVLRRPHTLLPRLVRSERNFSAYPKPTVYFIANALLAILLPLLSRLPKDGGAKDSILFSLSNINSQSALIFIAFCGYLLGIVLFSLLLKYFMRLFFRRTLQQAAVLRAACYSSAVFLPLLCLNSALSAVFNEFGGNNHLLIDLVQDDFLPVFFALIAMFAIQLVLSSLVWTYYVFAALQLRQCYHVLPILLIIALFSLFNFVGSVFPVLPRVLSVVSIDNFVDQYQKLLHHPVADDAQWQRLQSVSAKLAFEQKLPSQTRYKFALAALSYQLYLANPDTATLHMARLASNHQLSALESELDDYLTALKKKDSPLLRSAPFAALRQETENLRQMAQPNAASLDYTDTVTLSIRIDPFNDSPFKSFLLLTP